MQHPPNHPCKGFSLNLSSMTHEPLLPPWVAYPRDWTSSRSPKRSPPSRHELMSAGPGFFCWRKSFLRCIVKIPKNEKEMTWHWIIDAFFFSKKKTSVGNMAWCIHLKKKIRWAQAWLPWIHSTRFGNSHQLFSSVTTESFCNVVAVASP